MTDQISLDEWREIARDAKAVCAERDAANARAEAAEAKLAAETDAKNRIWRDFQVADAVANARWDEMQKQRARADAAEARLYQETIRADSEEARAEAAEREVERLRAEIDELDDFARQAVRGCVEIARRERARAEALARSGRTSSTLGPIG